MPPDSPSRSGLHLAEIVAAAIAIADSDGLEALSMRRVADRLGRAVMSLYRHVKDKEQLVALASDAVFGEEPFPERPPTGWRGRMHESAHRQWRCYHRHPWIASVVSLSRPRFGRNGMREMEWAFEGLQELDIDEGERLRLYLVVTAFVHGAAAQAAAEAAEVRGTGLEADEWWARQAAARTEVLSSGAFPLISRLAGSERPTPEAWFEFGLNCLLDGLQATLQLHSTRG